MTQMEASSHQSPGQDLPELWRDLMGELEVGEEQSIKEYRNIIDN